MPTSVRLPEKTEQRLKHLADSTGRSKAFYIREAIEEHLEDLEDIYLAKQRLEDVRTGRSKTIPLQEVMKRYDLEG